MSLTFDFTVNEQNQREAQAIMFGLTADVATKHSKKIEDAVDFLLNGNTVPFLEVMGQGANLFLLVESLPTPERRRFSAALSEQFLKNGMRVSPALKTWCLQTASIRVQGMLANDRQPKYV